MVNTEEIQFKVTNKDFRTTATPYLIKKVLVKMKKLGIRTRAQATNMALTKWVENND